MHTDRRGLPLTAANADAVAAFDATVDAYLGFARNTGDRLKATLKADPAMPLAHVLRGAFFLLMGKPSLLAKAAEASAAANRALDGVDGPRAPARGRARCLVQGRLRGGPPRVGGDPRRGASRRRGAEARALPAFLPGRLRRDARLGRTDAVRLGRIGPRLRGGARHARIRARGVGCVRRGRTHRPTRRRAESRRSLGGACRRARAGDAGPRAGGRGVDPGPRAPLGRMQQLPLPPVVAPRADASRARRTGGGARPLRRAGVGPGLRRVPRPL